MISISESSGKVDVQVGWTIVHMSLIFVQICTTCNVFCILFFLILTPTVLHIHDSEDLLLDAKCDQVVPVPPFSRVSCGVCHTKLTLSGM